MLKGQWEGLIQASQLQGWAVTTDHEPPPSVLDQLCRSHSTEQGILQHSLLPTGVLPGATWPEL